MNTKDICRVNDVASIPVEHRLLNIINELRKDGNNYHLVKLLWDCKSTIEWQYLANLKAEVKITELKDALENNDLI